MEKISLRRAKLSRNVDYFLGGLWVCLGVYLAFVGYSTLACFYMCMGPFLAHNAWRDYSFKSLIKESWDLIDDLEAHNNRLNKMIVGLQLPGHDDYNEGYSAERSAMPIFSPMPIAPT